MKAGDLIKSKGALCADRAIVISIDNEGLFPVAEVCWSCGKVQSFFVSNLEVIVEVQGVE